MDANKIEIGDRVRYADDKYPLGHMGKYFPPTGTLGTVVANAMDFDGTIEVRWDSGTKDPGAWWVPREYVKLVEKAVRVPCADTDENHVRTFKFTYQDKALNVRVVAVEASGYGEALPMAFENMKAGEKLLSIECFE